MLLVIEILFLVLGAWLIISGKIPSKFFRILFGKGEYELTARQTRLFGLFIASPIPLTIVVSFALTMLSGQSRVDVATVFELIYVLVVIVVALLVARKIKRPAVPQVTTDTSAQ